MTDTPTAAYVHVPFCRHRCGYCDFPLIAGRDDLVDDYLEALEIELAELEQPRPIETLFLGGGTPTHLRPAQLRRLMDLLRSWFRLSSGYEFSVEANPSGLDQARMEVLHEAGVNRISLGVQAFDAGSLHVLERDHQPTEARAVIEQLREYGFENLSLDLIFGVPGQSCADWHRSLEVALATGVAHVSTYGLTYEKGTTFWRRRELGTLVSLDEETEREMYSAAMQQLPAAGLMQYELSNFAQPGAECRHNLVYWRGESYFGFGPGAARYVDGVRSSNHRGVKTWLQLLLAGQPATAETELLPAGARARELIMLGLRMVTGIELARFRRQSGFDLYDLCGATVRQFVEAGLLEETEECVRLTREGRFLADTVTAEFL